MKQSKLPLLILKLGILFLIYSAIKHFLSRDYWQFYSDLEYIGIGLYIIYVYPKRKLRLNSDLMMILFMHFFSLSIHSLLTKNWIILFISVSADLGYIGYRIYRKRHKYTFILHR